MGTIRSVAAVGSSHKQAKLRRPAFTVRLPSLLPNRGKRTADAAVMDGDAAPRDSWLRPFHSGGRGQPGNPSLLRAKLLGEEFRARCRLSWRLVWWSLLVRRQHEGEFLQTRLVVKRHNFILPPRRQAGRIAEAVSKFSQVDQGPSRPMLYHEAGIFPYRFFVVVVGHGD